MVIFFLLLLKNFVKNSWSVFIMDNIVSISEIKEIIRQAGAKSFFHRIPLIYRLDVVKNQRNFDVMNQEWNFLTQW